MFFIVNILFVAAAVLLVLVIAATSSLPARQEAGDDSPEGEWMGRTRLPVAMARGPVVKRPAQARHMAAAGLQ